VRPTNRLTIKQIYEHPWFSDLDMTLELFNEADKEKIKKQYTYNDPRRYNRNENEEAPEDCFTEHFLDTAQNSLENKNSKSIILAPFNSTNSQIEEGLRQSVQDLLVDKMSALKLHRRVREVDR